METQENDGDDLYWRFLTFVNYAKAWAVQIETHADDSKRQSFIANMRRRTTALPVIESPLASRLMKHYVRGISELSRLERLSETNPGFGVLDSMTVPVHSYYAIHGVGSALAIALMGIEPVNHSKFCNVFTEVVTHLLPSPFDALCEIGDKPRSMRFRGLSADIEQVRSLKHNNFSPDVSEMFVAKSLLTTRKELIKEQLANRRASLKRKRLSPLEKDRCYRKVSRVSVIDLMWRLRCRSHYGDPFVYVSADNAEFLAAQFCAALHKLAESLVLSLSDVLSQVLGQEKFLLLERSLPNEIWVGRHLQNVGASS